MALQLVRVDAGDEAFTPTWPGVRPGSVLSVPPGGRLVLGRLQLFQRDELTVSRDALTLTRTEGALCAAAKERGSAVTLLRCGALLPLPKNLPGVTPIQLQEGDQLALASVLLRVEALSERHLLSPQSLSGQKRAREAEDAAPHGGSTALVPSHVSLTPLPPRADPLPTPAPVPATAAVRLCVVCQCEELVSTGLLCGSDHFSCADCLEHRAKSLAEGPAADIAACVSTTAGMSSVALPCPAGAACTAAALPISRLVHVSSRAVESLMAAGLKYAEFRGTAEAMETARRQASAAAARPPEEAAVEAAVVAVQEGFNEVCPRCSASFGDFHGCNAVTCNCGCGFCGLCLKDCGSDAHPHIASPSDRECACNPPNGPGGGTADQLTCAQKARRELKVWTQLQGMGGASWGTDARKAVLLRLQAQLEDPELLGLSVAHFSTLANYPAKDTPFDTLRVLYTRHMGALVKNPGAKGPGAAGMDAMPGMAGIDFAALMQAPHARHRARARARAPAPRLPPPPPPLTFAAQRVASKSLGVTPCRACGGELGLGCMVLKHLVPTALTVDLAISGVRAPAAPITRDAAHLFHPACFRDRHGYPMGLWDALRAGGFNALDGEVQEALYLLFPPADEPAA